MPVALSDEEFKYRLAQCVRQVSMQRSSIDVVGVVERHACELLNAKNAELVFFDDENNQLWRLTGTEEFSADLGILGSVARSRQGRRVLDTNNEPDYVISLDRPVSKEAESLLVEPVIDAFGVLQAVLVVARSRVQPFLPLDHSRLTALACSIAVFIQVLNSEQVFAAEQEALIIGPHDQLFNQEALERHRVGFKPGPMVEVPNNSWRTSIIRGFRQLFLFKRAKRLRFIQQLDASDCGAACLAMVLDCLGSKLSVSEIRKVLNAGPSGVSLANLLEIASRFDLLGRAVRVQPHQFSLLNTGMILHWEFNHLVVYEGRTPMGLVVLDPAVGRRTISENEFGVLFTGLALEFFPNAGFIPAKRRADPTLQYVLQIFHHPNLLRQALVASLLVQVFGMALPLLTAVVIDRVLPHANIGLLGLVLLGAVSAAVFGSLASFLRSHALVCLRAQFDQAATFKFVDHLLSLPYTFFQQRSPGDLMLRVYANSSIREILSSTVLSAALDGGLALIYAIVLFWLAPPLASVALGFGVFQVALVLKTRRSLSELMAAEWSARSRANSKLVQVLHGIQALKGAGAEAEGFRFWAGDFANELNSVNKRLIYNARLDAATHFFQNGAPAILLCIGALLVMKGSIPLGGMLAAATLSTAFLRPLMELVKNSISLLEVRVHVERIHDVVNAQPEKADAGEHPILPFGELDLQDIVFTYPGQDEPVINKISIKAQSGQSIALVGETGCGKSTLVHLILGFYPCDSGTIKFDNQDISNLNLKSLRRQIGYVPQSSYVFEGSVRDNISLSHPEASLAEIIDAARVACIHDEIMAMDNGYDTRLIANGDSVSGGQRQRIALARALLCKPKILIMDEATSALDGLTEAKLTKNLNGLACTRIVVAHRLSTIQLADVIYVISRGRVVEYGNHKNLMTCKSVYSQLVSAQLAEAISE
jgi:ATP-binding cassette subfamily B protein